MEEKKRVALLVFQVKGEDDRITPQVLCRLSLVSRERLYSQAGVCDKTQGSHSLGFFVLQLQKGGVC